MSENDESPIEKDDEEIVDPKCHACVYRIVIKILDERGYLKGRNVLRILNHAKYIDKLKREPAKRIEDSHAEAKKRVLETQGQKERAQHQDL
jgi:hypothetical protein